MSEKSALGATIKDLNSQLETLQELSDVTEQRLEDLEAKGKQEAFKNEEAKRKLQDSLSREQAERENAEAREANLQSQISDIVSIWPTTQAVPSNSSFLDSPARPFSAFKHIIAR